MLVGVVGVAARTSAVEPLSMAKHAQFKIIKKKMHKRPKKVRRVPAAEPLEQGRVGSCCLLRFMADQDGMPMSQCM